MTTNLLIAVYLIRKFEADPRACIRLRLKVQTIYPFGVWPGSGNRAKKRIATL